MMRVTIPEMGVLQGATLIDSTTKKAQCNRFSRIPYALPPTGNRRWRKPEPLPDNFSYGSDSHPGQYTKPSSPCPQSAQFGVLSADEDCLQLNIWVPLGDPPSGGWPVYFYIHGGFLQFGSNGSDNPQYLLSETDVKCIVVSANYRLGVFGFLASRELHKDSSTANFGLWDQRMALEWTYGNIEFFGGNSQNITVGGLSAGAYATFHQLAHDIGHNSRRQIIKRVIQLSNGCGVQPKTITEAQHQFDDLIRVLGISSLLSEAKKLEVLRTKTADELVGAVEQMKQKFIRPILDGEFISEDLFQNLYSGQFGLRMKELGIQTIIGDLTQEWQVYKMFYTPNSYDELVDRLSWDYPRHISEAACAPYKSSNSNEWMEIFGRLYADMQIHSTMRGFIKCISSSLPLDHIHRYRIDWRTQSTDKRLPREVGATHATDLSIWWFGNGDSLSRSEKDLIREWLQPMGAFLRGEKVGWGTKSLRNVRYLSEEAKIEIREDELWETKLPLWEVTKRITEKDTRSKLGQNQSKL